MKDHRGWGLPAAARKAHYFDGIMSLCGSWMYSGPLVEGNSARCAKCERALTVRQQVREASDDN